MLGLGGDNNDLRLGIDKYLIQRKDKACLCALRVFPGICTIRVRASTIKMRTSQ